MSIDAYFENWTKTKKIKHMHKWGIPISDIQDHFPGLRPYRIRRAVKIKAETCPICCDAKKRPMVGRVAKLTKYFPYCGDCGPIHVRRKREKEAGDLFGSMTMGEARKKQKWTDNATPDFDNPDKITYRDWFFVLDMTAKRLHEKTR